MENTNYNTIGWRLRGTRISKISRRISLQPTILKHCWLRTSLEILLSLHCCTSSFTDISLNSFKHLISVIIAFPFSVTNPSGQAARKANFLFTQRLVVCTLLPVAFVYASLAFGSSDMPYFMSLVWANFGDHSFFEIQWKDFQTISPESFPWRLKILSPSKQACLHFEPVILYCLSLNQAGESLWSVVPGISAAPKLRAVIHVLLGERFSSRVATCSSTTVFLSLPSS